ncbi:MAG: hypothetical protein R6U84_07250 [Candidatus Cloacimonadales bacterium]
MSKTMLLLYIIVILLLLVGFRQITGRVELEPGMMVEDVPRQISLPKAENFQHQQMTITPLAEFSLQAKVLAKKRYFWGKAGKLAPYDFALGWQQMSDQDIVQQFKISQSNRWYYWRARKLPLSKQEVIRSSSNMHLIPQNKAVAKKMRQAKIGQIISLDGYLVRAWDASGWNWQSSLSRQDSGSNSCEVVFVKNFEIIIKK